MTRLASPAARRARAQAARARLRRDPHQREGAGRPTLEERISRVWAGLAEHGHAECPVCGGELRIGGCRGCGAQLS
jgi:hypothetical protein